MNSIRLFLTGHTDLLLAKSMELHHV